ncbi:hypothetical protein LOK49_LG12G00045 [Camellia lanceoleosa]|uniref:Uncharacterized protein n=1 Tax=Camellia lanceoleosa TaxID=1840588 RepID=A0ACC0FPW6_9ERIC|nr:hypothetical protein LOK49_LG12G00045 [Camellia lanceoleosa]
MVSPARSRRLGSFPFFFLSFLLPFHDSQNKKKEEERGEERDRGEAKSETNQIKAKYMKQIKSKPNP